MKCLSDLLFFFLLVCLFCSIPRRLCLRWCLRTIGGLWWIEEARRSFSLRPISLVAWTKVLDHWIRSLSWWMCDLLAVSITWLPFCFCVFVSNSIGLEANDSSWWRPSNPCLLCRACKKLMSRATLDFKFLILCFLEFLLWLSLGTWSSDGVCKGGRCGDCVHRRLQYDYR